jgi:hypothetical protein
MAEVLTRLRRDPLLAGYPVPIATSGPVAGRHGLELWPDDTPGTARSAALIAATISALEPTESLQELEPTSIDSARLASWERLPANPTAATESSRPFGRFLWAAALILLMVEELIRRRSRGEPISIANGQPAEKAA